MSTPDTTKTINDLESQQDEGQRDATAYNDETFEMFLEMVYDEKEILKNAVATIIERLIPTAKRNFLVEVGAGTGAMLNGYIDKFKRALLIEPSNKYGDTLENKFPKAKVIHDLFQNVELEENPNCVCASHVIRYLPNPLVQLNKMLDSLADGGKVIITMSDLESQYTQFIKDFSGIKYDDHEFNVGNIKDHLKKYGINFDTEKVISHFRWNNIDELIRVMPVVIGGITVKDITPQNRLQIEAYVQQFKKDDGTYEMEVGHEILVIDKPIKNAIEQ